MALSTFQTNPYDLKTLLDDCDSGVRQLPDFQRSWVWDEDRIKSLIASVSRKCSSLDRQIDNLVYELYDLAPEEIAIVEGQTK